MSNLDRPSNIRSTVAFAFLAASIWWLFPLSLLSLSPHTKQENTLDLVLPGILAFCAISAVCAANRAKDWCVVLWMPAAGFCMIGSVFVLVELIREGATPPGSKAPLAGVASLLAFCTLAIFVGAAIFLFRIRPKKFPAMLSVFAALNSIAVTFAVREADCCAHKQEIAIHILDFEGHPIEGATLHYKRFRYGPGGNSVFRSDGTPIVSDADGIVRPHSRSMHNEVRGSIQHPGYERISFILGMRFSKWDRSRNFTIGIKDDPNICRGDVSANDPLSAYVYLPPRHNVRVHDRSQAQEAATMLTTGADTKSYLNLESATFGSASEADLRFELFLEPVDKHTVARLGIHALNGAGVQMLSPRISFSEPAESPSLLFEIAPRQGYADMIIIAEPSNSRGPKIFVSNSDQTEFHMLRVRLNPDRKAGAAHCFVNIVKNIPGVRIPKKMMNPIIHAGTANFRIPSARLFA